MGKIIAFIPTFFQTEAENTNLFCAKPLIYWCLDALEKNEKINEVYIEIENTEIISTIKTFGFKKIYFVPRFLEITSEEKAVAFVSTKKFSENDLILTLPTASPFLQSVNLTEVIQRFQTESLFTLLSCVRVKQGVWSDFGAATERFKTQIIENEIFYLSRVSNLSLFRKVIYGILSFYEMPEYTLNKPEKEWEVAEILMKKYVLSQKISNKKIRLFATDVDGVLTDAGMYYSESGDELKKFNTHDGMGLVLLQKTGVKTAIITSENTKMVENRAKKLKVDYLYQGKKYGGKLAAILEMCEKENISLENVAYIGDDVNCFEALSNVGLAACPADAEPEIVQIPNILKMRKKGGEGCVREFIRLILDN